MGQGNKGEQGESRLPRKMLLVPLEVMDCLFQAAAGISSNRSRSRENTSKPSPPSRGKSVGRKIRVTPANCPKLEIAFVNKFSNFGTKIEFVCSHLIKLCLFLWRETRRL